MTDRPKCGTYAAVQAHRKFDEPLDDACRKADAEYMQEWRKTPTGKAAIRRQGRAEKIKRRAWVRLAAYHPAEFEFLLAEERSRADHQERKNHG